MRSIFMNKKTIIFRVYQANRLDQRAENQYVAGIIIIESPCSSTEESDYKSLSYDSKGNYVQQMRDRDVMLCYVIINFVKRPGCTKGQACRRTSHKKHIHTRNYKNNDISKYTCKTKLLQEQK